jgi:hypothetical protein
VGHYPSRALNHDVEVTLLCGSFTKEAYLSAKPLIQVRRKTSHHVFKRTLSNSSAEPLSPSTLSRRDGGGVSEVHGGGLLPEVRLPWPRCAYFVRRTKYGCLSKPHCESFVVLTLPYLPSWTFCRIYQPKLRLTLDQ